MTSFNQQQKRHKDRIERLAKANQLIHTIATCGRRFLQWEGVVSAIVRWDANGRLYWHDAWFQKRIDLHAPNADWFNKFNGGGTLKDLVKELKDYIWTGKQLHPLTFGPWENWPDEEGGLWGYGKDMEMVRQAARDLGITEPA